MTGEHILVYEIVKIKADASLKMQPVAFFFLKTSNLSSHVSPVGEFPKLIRARFRHETSQLKRYTFSKLVWLPTVAGQRL